MSSIDNFIKELGGNFISLVKSIGVLDVFDIILVAVLIYYAFNFLRNRRAGQLVFGVVILFALQLLSDLLGLVATQFILQNVLQLGLIALLCMHYAHNLPFESCQNGCQFTVTESSSRAVQ